MQPHAASQRIFVLVASLILALTLAACGGSSSQVAATSGTPAASGTDAPPTQGDSSPVPTGDTASAVPSPEQAGSGAETAIPDEPPSTPASPTATAEPMVYPDSWKDMPAVPTQIGGRMWEVYALGQQLGRDPHAFSVVGDCQNVTAFFLSGFGDPNLYNLGPYEELQELIDWFNESGSFTRDRVAVEGGYNVAAVLSPLWNDAAVCDIRESPLACEYRINNPAYAFISMETWWYDRPAETYASYLSQIVEYSLSQGVIPILATKADNIEGDFMEDWAINQAIVRVAQTYDVPLWNFWAASYPLPDHGLRLSEGDSFHLSYEGPMFHFQDPANLQYGWPIRNLTALQTLDAVWRSVTHHPATGA